MPAPAETRQPLDEVLPRGEQPQDIIPPLSAFAPKKASPETVVTTIFNERLDAIKAPRISSDQPIPPSQSQILEANSTRRPLRTTLGDSPAWLSAGTGLAGIATLSTAAACALPAGGQPDIRPATTPQKGATAKPESPRPTSEMSERELQIEVARRFDEARNYYIDPAGKIHYKVEVDDKTNMYQCTDGAKAVAIRYGIPTSTITHASAKDYLTPNYDTNEWWEITHINGLKITETVPKKGSLVVFGPGVGDENGHVGVFTGVSRIENGDMFLEILSQNYAAGPMEIRTFSVKNDDIRGWLYPKKLGPKGEFPKREIAFTNEGASPSPLQTSAPTPEITPTPSGGETVDISEFTDREKAYYFAAMNFLSFFTKEAPYTTQFDDRTYTVHSSKLTITPESATIEDIAAELVDEELLMIGTSPEYDALISYTEPGKGTYVIKYKLWLNDMRMDNKSFSGFQWDPQPITPDYESRFPGIWFHSYSHMYLNIASGGVHGRIDSNATPEEVEEFIAKIEAVEVTYDDMGPFLPFHQDIYTVLTDQGHFFNPDFANLRASYTVPIGDYNLEMNPDVVNNWMHDTEHLQEIKP